MKRRLTYLVLVVACAAVPLTAAGQTVEELAAAGPQASDYPEANAAVLLRDETVAPDGSGGINRTVRSVVKILTAAGRDRFSDSRVMFNDAHTELTAAARSLTADGQLKDVEADAINTVTPPWLTDPGFYGGIRDRVFSFAAAGPDVVTELTYTTHSRLPDPQQCAGAVVFQGWEPVLQSRLTVTVPAASPFRHKMFNGEVEPVRTVEGANARYTFELKDLAGIKREELSPDLAEMSPRLVYSAYADWKEATAAFRQRFRDAAKPTALIKQKARELAGDIAGPDRDARALDRLAAYVVGEIRPVTVPLELTGYAPHAAEAVLSHGAGDQLDKAALLAALLDARGIDAWPVLAHDKRLPIARDVPALQQFNTVLLATVIDKEMTFVALPQPAAQVGYVPGCAGSDGLLVRGKAPEFVRIVSRKGTESRAATNLDLTLSAEGDAMGKISVKLTGDFDQDARSSLGRLNDAQRTMALDSALSELSPDAKSTARTLSGTHDLLTPMTITDDMALPGFAALQNEIMLIEIPEIPYESARLRAAPRLETRDNPLQISAECEELYIVRIQMPAGFEPMYLPKPFAYEDEFGAFTVDVQREPGSSEIRVIRSKVFRDRTVPAGRYGTYREQMSNLDNLRNRLIMLRRAAGE